VGPEEAVVVVVAAGPEEVEVAVDVVVGVVVGPAEAVVGPAEAEEQAVDGAAVVVGQAEVVAAVDVVVGQAEVAAARGVAAEGAMPVVLSRIIPAALLSATTRSLPNRILFARRTACGT